MKKDLAKQIGIPESTEVLVSGNKVVAKRNGKELSKIFDIGRISILVSDGSVALEAKKASKREAKMMGTIAAHLKNMLKGLEKDFVYELEICHVHFPMNVGVSENSVVIKSFLGETTERRAKILDDVSVDISGNRITVTSFNIEAAGQTAANLEKAVRLQGRDRRIFQDGIFITKKPYRVI
jgi:large subunit ribosomal protein L6